MKTTTYTLTALLIVSVGGCAHSPPPKYVRAAAVEETPPPPAIVEVPRPLPLPGQLKRVHDVTAEKASRGKRRPSDVIRDANRKATAGPDPDGYINAIMTYDYIDGALYQVYAAPQRLTDIQLQPGEKIVGKPATGDNIRWVLARGSSATSGTEQQHLYIKPTRPELETTIAINTDRRCYLLELHSYDDTYMAAVQWRYPQDEISQLEATMSQQDSLAQATTASNVNIDKLNFGYGVAVMKGRPIWTPTQVFDDGHKTYIRFPAAMLDREAPALFVVSATNDTQLVNYRMRNDFFVVDRLFEQAELRLGQQDQDVVRIVRTR
jgi:P-type conjugative transfer protein TrbG